MPITPGRRQRPASRTGQFLALEEAVRDALAGKPDGQFSIHAPALARGWKDRLPLRVRADRAADLLGTVKFLREQQRSGYLVGGAEAEKVQQRPSAAPWKAGSRPRPWPGPDSVP